MHYNEKIFKRLSEFKDNLYAAKYCGYVRFGSREQKERLAAIYEEHFGKKSGILNGCSRCLLNDTRALASLYFEDLKEMENAAKQVEVQADAEPEAVQDQPEPKADNSPVTEEVTNKPKVTRATKRSTKK